jgi:hypothetical protein
MIFSKAITGNSRTAADQWAEVAAKRNVYRANEQVTLAAHKRAAGLRVNAGLIPKDVYQAFDTAGVERMRLDDGDVFLNDLMPMSKSVSIGKLVHKFRQASDAGNAQTTMTGQTGVLFDQVEYTYDGSIVPVHDAGFGRNWREWNAQTSEGFDALIDDARETTATLRARLANNFLDGHLDKNGNFIKVDGLDWQGMRNDSRVAQVDLGAGGLNFDFTDNTKTGEEIKAAFIQLRDTLRISNKCGKDVTYYTSLEIESNFERKFSKQYDSKTLQQELSGLAGVAAIKASNKLSGNEIMGFPLDSSSVRPIVGMGINTVAMPRPLYNSDYNFVVWGAVGYEVRTDFAGNTCALFAQDLT